VTPYAIPCRSSAWCRARFRSRCDSAA
jgi:hypothetical protein